MEIINILRSPRVFEGALKFSRFRDLPWKLKAAEHSADHIASLCAEI